jgi:hypothetical protein
VVLIGSRGNGQELPFRKLGQEYLSCWRGVPALFTEKNLHAFRVPCTNVLGSTGTSEAEREAHIGWQIDGAERPLPTHASSSCLTFWVGGCVTAIHFRMSHAGTACCL